MAGAGKPRLAYIDWMRGLACVLMFQTHCYDSWLGPEARQSTFYMYSQLGGTLPAPLFLFLAGISFALVTDKLRKGGATAGEAARTTIRRGAEIFALGLAFRLQQYLFNWRWAPWTDLLRVDILNTIGLSMMLMGVACWVASADERNRRTRTVGLALTVTLCISMATPLLWTSWRPRWLPWPLESYINGVHIFNEPQGWFFPVFPWAGFAFAGLATGIVLLSDYVKLRQERTFALFGVAGVGLILFARWLDHSPWQLYPVYDFWRTSPNFFLIRVGLLLVVLSVTYAWCRWGAGQWGFSPIIQLGMTSLLVYWVHIEFVYGRLTLLRSRGNGVGAASVGLLIIFVSMLALSYARTYMKARKLEPMAVLRRAAGRGV